VRRRLASSGKFSGLFMNTIHFIQQAGITPCEHMKISADESEMRHGKVMPFVDFSFEINSLTWLQTVTRHCFDFRFH
jgi:hypothetical protein